MHTQNVLDFDDDEFIHEEYNEDIIKHCNEPPPSDYFTSEEFLQAFETQCTQVSTFPPSWLL